MILLKYRVCITKLYHLIYYLIFLICSIGIHENEKQNNQSEKSEISSMSNLSSYISQKFEVDTMYFYNG